MKNKYLIAISIILASLITIGLFQVINLLVIGIYKTAGYIHNPLGDVFENPAIVIINSKNKNEKIFFYNERAPEKIVRGEIEKQSKEFNLDPAFMLKLAECESNFNNLAENPVSTAQGVYQYLIGTWEETESWKNEKRARTDYKANIREAMIDIANGEYFRFKECLNK